MCNWWSTWARLAPWIHRLWLRSALSRFLIPDMVGEHGWLHSYLGISRGMPHGQKANHWPPMVLPLFYPSEASVFPWNVAMCESGTKPSRTGRHFYFHISKVAVLITRHMDYRDNKEWFWRVQGTWALHHWAPILIIKQLFCLSNPYFKVKVYWLW